MKIKDGFVLRKVAGSYLVVAFGQQSIDFNGMISLNDTGAFLWNKLANDVDRDELVEAMLQEYDVSREQVEKDVDSFIKKLEDNNLAE